MENACFKYLNIHLKGRLSQLPNIFGVKVNKRDYFTFYNLIVNIMLSEILPFPP